MFASIRLFDRPMVSVGPVVGYAQSFNGYNVDPRGNSVVSLTKFGDVAAVPLGTTDLAAVTDDLDGYVSATATRVGETDFWGRTRANVTTL